MKLTITIKHCGDCPHYCVQDDEECSFGAIHTCGLMVEDEDSCLAVGGMYGENYPEIKIPRNCPLKRKKKK